MCLHASMPVCEHVSVSSAPQMCQGPESCWGSISRSLVEEASVYAECALSPKLTPTSASHPGVCLQITCPSLKALFSLEAAPSMQVALAPQNGSGQERGGYWLSCAGTREGPGMESAEVWKSYSTWINLSAKAALSYQAKGIPSNGGRRQSRRQGTGDRRGERQTRTTCH